MSNIIKISLFVLLVITSTGCEKKNSTYSVNIIVTPNDSVGVVLIDPPVAPSGTYELTLTATENPGYVFSNWSGDISENSNPTTVTVDSEKTIYANFMEEEPYPPFDFENSAQDWNVISVPGTSGFSSCAQSSEKAFNGGHSLKLNTNINQENSGVVSRELTHPVDMRQKTITAKVWLPSGTAGMMVLLYTDSSGSTCLPQAQTIQSTNENTWFTAVYATGTESELEYVTGIILFIGASDENQSCTNLIYVDLVNW